MDNTKQNIETQHHSCPNCGAKTEFDPRIQKLVCPYCNSHTEITNTSASEQDIDNLFENSKVWSETEVVECENCGAKETLSRGQIATSCPFCGTTNIIKTSEFVGMAPHGICPFMLTNSEASTIAQNWSKKKPFAPNSFKKSATAKAIKGVYSPVFTFDCTTDTIYRGTLGERKTRTRRNLDGNTERESYTDYFPISGTHSAVHNDVLVNASSKISDSVMHELNPIPTNESVTYDDKYLVGYTASTYAKNGNQAWSEGKSIIDYAIKCQILKQYNYDIEQEFRAVSTYHNRKFKYLLLPVYIGHYKHKNKVYNFYINGCTGKMSGKAPVSWVKVLFTVLAGILAVGAIFALFR